MPILLKVQRYPLNTGYCDLCNDNDFSDTYYAYHPDADTWVHFKCLDNWLLTHHTEGRVTNESQKALNEAVLKAVKESLINRPHGGSTLRFNIFDPYTSEVVVAYEYFVK